MSDLDLRHADLPSGRVAYVDEGEGPAVLMLHGFPTSSHLWRDLVPLLSIRFRAVAPDMSGRVMSLDAQAAAARELLAHLALDGAAVLGHDAGGGVAQLLAVAGEARALVLIDSTSFEAPAGAPPVRDGVSGFLEAAVNRVEIHERDREAYEAAWHEPLLEEAAAALAGPARPEIVRALGRLDLPALVVWGEEDPFRPAADAERLWEILPDAAIALLPGCSHLVTEDAPDTVLPLVAQFLRSRYLGEPGHDHAHGPVAVDLGVSFERPARAEEPDA